MQLPAGIEVLIDGRSIGRAPLRPIAVRQGAHELWLRRPDLGEMRLPITVQAGMSLPFQQSESAIRDAHAAAQERLARKVLALGGRERALGVAADAFAINPTYEPLRSLLNELLATAHHEEEAARNAADQAGHTARRSSFYAAAEGQHDTAARARRAGRFEEAIRAFWMARLQFDRAAARAQ
jgi:hypothetical protein